MKAIILYGSFHYLGGEESIARLIKGFTDIYDAKYAGKTKPYGGIDELLDGPVSEGAFYIFYESAGFEYDFLIDIVRTSAYNVNTISLDGGL